MAWEWGAQVLEMLGLAGRWKALSCQALAICREWREFIGEAISHKPLVISREQAEFIISVGKQRGEEVVIVGDWFVEAVRARLAIAAEHEVAEMREEAGFGRREEAIGDGDGEFGEDAADFMRGDQGAARGDEFAGEIGGTKAAVRGVGVAEAVALRMSGEGAAASIGESKSASSVC
jgi:hypothetical protein